MPLVNGDGIWTIVLADASETPVLYDGLESWGVCFKLHTGRFGMRLKGVSVQWMLFFGVLISCWRVFELLDLFFVNSRIAPHFCLISPGWACCCTDISVCILCWSCGKSWTLFRYIKKPQPLYVVSWQQPCLLQLLLPLLVLFCKIRNSLYSTLNILILKQLQCVFPSPYFCSFTSQHYK